MIQQLKWLNDAFYLITAPRKSIMQGMKPEVRGVHCDRMQNGGTNRHWEILDDVLGNQIRLKKERVANTDNCVKASIDRYQLQSCLMMLNFVRPHHEHILLYVN